LKFILLLATSFLISCSTALKKGTSQVGRASWYGANLKGHRTASGEKFDPQKFTAAHRTLPFGTYVLVKSLSNGRMVRVRVNDRGPFVEGRIIDLSYAAAARLGFVSKGEDEVEISPE
jgi:rare lipoprotein A